MEHYVTLFDSLFLPQGIALRDSLEKHGGAHTLWVLCMDDETYEVLTRLRLANLKPVHLSSVETPQLLQAKKDRTRVEYCWTLTPFTPGFVFQRDAAIERVTYVDADLWFRRNPAPIFRELEESGKQILITEHDYAAEHDQSATSGRFCVQFVTFRRDGSEAVRKWWEERCIEWCYARQENGKFGDQKYLDDWPERFGEHVHVLRNNRLIRAPWNGPSVSDEDPVFYHFHALRLLDDNKANLGGYPLSRRLIREFYEPYMKELGKAVRTLRKAGYEPKPQQRHGMMLNLKRTLFWPFTERRRFVLMPLAGR
jgi:hypothetical protein